RIRYAPCTRDLHRQSAAGCDNRRDVESSPPLLPPPGIRHRAVSWSCLRMNLPFADVRLWLVRASGLVRRGVASLRTRGWRHSWERVKLRFIRPPAPMHAPLIDADRSAFAPFAVPCAEVPEASIVVPVHGQWPHTLACLRAIAAHPPQAPFELIVVDDAS